MKNIIRRFYILPAKGTGFREQLDECINRIKSYFDNSRDYQIVHQLFFVKSESNNEYISQKEEIFSSLEKIYTQVPSASVIAQLPDNGFLVTVELMVLMNRTENIEISYKNSKGIYYTVIKTEDYRQLFAGGITIYEPDRDYQHQANGAYSLMNDILDSESMSFSDVVRQWNYIEDILGIKTRTDKEYQNYHHHVEEGRPGTLDLRQRSAANCKTEIDDEWAAAAFT